MTAFVDAHRETLDRALAAIADRGYWSNYPESPSPRVYGEAAAADGLAAYEAHLGRRFELNQPGTVGWVGFERTVLRMRSASLERHHERLPTGVHDRVRQLEAALVDPVHDLDADRGPHLRAGVPPGRHCLPGGGQQHVEVGLGIGHPELRPVR